MSRKCDRRSDIDNHFAGRSSSKRQAAVHAHLDDCQPCHDYYQRHLLLEQLTKAPMQEVRKHRIGIGLGLRPPSIPPWRRMAPLLIPAVALAGMLLLLTHRATQAPELAARGSVLANGQNNVMVYEIDDSNHAEPAVGVITRNRELALSYRNPQRFNYLAVFAVDERRNVYWLAPTWIAGDSVPETIAIEHQGQAEAWHEVPQAVRHHFTGSLLTFYAIFSQQRISAYTIELWISNAKPPIADMQNTQLEMLGAFRLRETP
jgi:hypothetical protein